MCIQMRIPIERLQNRKPEQVASMAKYKIIYFGNGLSGLDTGTWIQVLAFEN